MILNWIHCEGNVACELFRLNLETIREDQGVYVIWYYLNQQIHAIHVGQVCSDDRTFKERFAEHKTDKDILKYRCYGSLYVTWASVDHQFYRNGIERYLFNVLKPLEGERAPSVTPIPANLPHWFIQYENKNR